MTKVTKLSGYSRFDLLKLLEGRTNLVGIELGVASGDYSAKMLDSGKFFQFFGVICTRIHMTRNNTNWL